MHSLEGHIRNGWNNSDAVCILLTMRKNQKTCKARRPPRKMK